MERSSRRALLRPVFRTVLAEWTPRIVAYDLNRPDGRTRVIALSLGTRKETSVDEFSIRKRLRFFLIRLLILIRLMSRCLLFSSTSYLILFRPNTLLALHSITQTLIAVHSFA